ncbi:hypothetical protein WI664_01365, partial [Vibrio cholerae]
MCLPLGWSAAQYLPGHGRPLLMIDNCDSFTYNLYQCFCELGAQVKVVRNDE